MKRCSLLFILIIALFITACSTGNTVKEASMLPTSESALFHFIDVGQGDCILIQDTDTNILIDAGTTESGSAICAYLENLGINYLDCFIGTHPHEDHLGGAAAVLSEFKVGKVYLNGETSNSYFFERLVDTLLNGNITPNIPEFNSVYQFGNFGVEFLSPTIDFENTNNNSLVTMVSYGNIKALFTGDSERPVEAELVKSGVSLNADILKTGHHGSRNASSDEFLMAVNPRVAVIQCGKDNSYGHPHIEVLERLERLSIPVLRTDETGSVVLRTDGTSILNASGEEFEKRENITAEITYIGNKKSKVYHSEACKNLPSEKNQVLFSTPEDAEKMHFTPCGNCMP